MYCFTLGVIEIIFKDLYKQNQETNVFNIDVNNAVLYDRVSFNNGKD